MTNAAFSFITTQSLRGSDNNFSQLHKRRVGLPTRRQAILHLFAVKSMLPANDSAGNHFLSAPLVLPFIRPR
jgi:hypothetical protein